MEQIVFIYSYKIIRLITLIFTISYFVGTLWFIMTQELNSTDCTNRAEIIAWQIASNGTETPTEPQPECSRTFTFQNEYSLPDKTDLENLIIVVYFALTTLSTVGFGDYNPKSDFERVVACFILLIGVAVFSFLMSNFIDILLSYKTVTAENAN